MKHGQHIFPYGFLVIFYHMKNEAADSCHGERDQLSCDVLSQETYPVCLISLWWHVARRCRYAIFSKLTLVILPAFTECPIPGEISLIFIRKDSASSRSLPQKRTCAACVKRLRQEVSIQNGSKSTTGETQRLVIHLYLNGGWRLRQNARRVFLQIKLCPSWRAVVSTPLDTTSVLVAEWLFSSKRLVQGLGFFSYLKILICTFVKKRRGPWSAVYAHWLWEFSACG